MNALATMLGDLFGQIVAQAKHAPKFCRTRGCSLRFQHEGPHDGVPTPKAGPARKPKPTAKPHRTAGAARSDAWRSRAGHSLDAHARRAGR